MHIVLQQVKHAIFERNNDDLIVQQTITLLEALTGFDLPIQTLDGKHLLVHVQDDIIQPGQNATILTKGMPKVNENGSFGNLIIVFQIEFPTHLNREMKQYLRYFLHPEFAKVQQVQQEMRTMTQKMQQAGLVPSAQRTIPNNVQVRSRKLILFQFEHVQFSDKSFQHKVVPPQQDNAKKSFCATQ